MKRVGIVALTLLALVAVGCSRTKVVPHNEAHMSGSSFLQSSVTVKAGQPVKFIDGPEVEHKLVVGTDGKLASVDGAPSQLTDSAGMAINPGQEIDVVFNTPGTYPVTCTIHPSMQISVTVTQ
jgi:plastocyanin